MGDELMKILPVETQDLIRQMATQAPSLADLTSDQAEVVAKAVLADYLKDQMKRAVLSHKVSFKEEQEKFLSGLNSAQTKRAYMNSLKVFSDWLDHQSLSLVDLTPAKADDFIRDQRATGKSDETTRARVATISSFYTFLERRFSEVRNPFRGTKVRPKSTRHTAIIPSPGEIDVILNRAEPKVKVAIAIMVETGLRVGGLAGLRIKSDGTFHTQSKGKEFAGPDPLPVHLREMIKSAGLSPYRPFNPENHKVKKQRASSLESHEGDQGAPPTSPATLVTMALTSRITRHTKKLKEDGVIAEAYSPHDFRHAFSEANAQKGLIWLRDRLGHSSISVTERYLRNTLGRSTVEL